MAVTKVVPMVLQTVAALVVRWADCSVALTEHARVASTAVELVGLSVVNWAEATAETKAVPWVAKKAVELAVRWVDCSVVTMEHV